MMRLFISSLVGLLIYVQSGLFDLAYATRCSDVIPGQTFTYSDALTGFTAWNGKTYAIAKAVISGIMNNPDAFFVFAANPQQARDDTTSLKAKVAAGYYGDARPVRIDSNVTRDVIRTQFGRFLESSPSSPRTTYVDAWKNYASVAFTHMDDTALSWSDWVTNPPQGNYSAMAVVMTSDGKIAYGVDGPRSAQIVEFDGELDCAQPFTAGAPIVGGTTPPDGTVNPPPDIEPETPNRDDPNAIQGVYCGGDMDGDGTVLGPGEIMNCLQSTNPPGGEFCPTAAVPCSVSGTSQEVIQQCAVGFWSTCNDPEIFISPNTSTWLPAECDGTGYQTWLSVDAQCKVVSAAAAGWAEATCVVNESRTAYTCTPHVAFSQPVVGHSVRAVTQTVPGIPSYTCPLGSQYTCMADPTDSVMKCSPYACVNPDDEDGEEITDAPETIFHDDGARDADGTCLDQVMIFSGKSSRCRPPGLTVGYMNNCCESDTPAK